MSSRDSKQTQKKKVAPSNKGTGKRTWLREDEIEHLIDTVLHGGDLPTRYRGAALLVLLEEMAVDRTNTCNSVARRAVLRSDGEMSDLFLDSYVKSLRREYVGAPPHGLTFRAAFDELKKATQEAVKYDTRRE